MTQETQEAKNVIVFGNATIDEHLFKAYTKKAMDELTEQDTHATAAKNSGMDFKDTVEVLHKSTKIPKKDLMAYFKARFAEKKAEDEAEAKAKGTQATVERGHLYEVLNSTLEN